MILYPKLFIEIFEGRVIELPSIVWHQYPRNPKSAYDALPNEVLDILLCDFCEGFNFHPFSEVIDPHY